MKHTSTDYCVTSNSDFTQEQDEAAAGRTVTMINRNHDEEPLTGAVFPHVAKIVDIVLVESLL